MTSSAWQLLALTVLGAAWMVVHVYLLFGCLRSREHSLRLKLLALIPVVTPGMAWTQGRRAVPVAWCILLACYLGLRIV